jgi:hypothetical protein
MRNDATESRKPSVSESTMGDSRHYISVPDEIQEDAGHKNSIDGESVGRLLPELGRDGTTESRQQVRGMNRLGENLKLMSLGACLFK